MTDATISQPLLLDMNPLDPSEALAARYMRTHLDEELRRAEDITSTEKVPESTRELLRLRYGAALANVVKKKGERWKDAVARASVSRARKVRPDVDAYVVEWDQAAATEWFLAQVERRWPVAQVGAPFLAADVVTLWTVCLALDLALPRTARFADDQFPAPPLLITGPTGIGKELLSKAIHESSGRAGAFGAINCGGLPTQLLESELFGHVKGAFTGASRDKVGLVQEYGAGTLFLDEVGDMPMEVQVRLLRFLNNGEARKVGQNRSYQAFPRIIAATHVDLDARAEKGEFRLDLLHRLRGRHLHLRGLAERPALTLAPVVGQFLSVAAASQKQPRPTLTTEAKVALTTYGWPGNMRELKYVVERILVQAARTTLVELDTLPDEVVASYLQRTSPPLLDVLSVVAARERGEPNSHSQTRLKLLLGERFKQHSERTDTRAASLLRTADVVDRMGRAFGLEKESKPHAQILRMAAQEALADEFQKKTLAQLRRSATQMEIDLDDAVGMYERMAETLRTEAREASTKLEILMKASETRYAATAVLAAGVRVACESESKIVGSAIKFADTMLELAESPPFSASAKRLGKRFGKMKPDHARAAFRELLSNADDAPGAPAEWNKVRNDLSALEHVVEDAGSITRAAKVLSKRPETISRRLAALRRKSGGAARQRRSRRK